MNELTQTPEYRTCAMLEAAARIWLESYRDGCEDITHAAETFAEMARTAIESALHEKYPGGLAS